MACTNKILAKKNKKSGEVTLIGAVNKFTPEQIRALENTNLNYSYFKLPCGRCMSCRLKKSKEWAIRIIHETNTSSTACFITLTLDYNRIVQYLIDYKKMSSKKAEKQAYKYLWTLDTKLFQDFMKRLRKKVYPIKIRFFHCGEYGSQGTKRPHHHAIIFNYDFPDRKVHSYKKLDNGMYIQYYISKELEELWPLGFHIISEVTENSAGYVARYTTKKINGDLKDLYYNGRKQEYITMSRRPGIGYDWFMKYGTTDCFPNDFVLSKDKLKYKPSRYYDKLYDIIDPIGFAKVQEKRQKFSHDSLININKLSYEDTKERQAINKFHDNNKVKNLIRCLDDENQENFKFIEFVNKCTAFGIPKEFCNEAIEIGKRFENKNLTAFDIANQYLDENYGRLSYEDLKL